MRSAQVDGFPRPVDDFFGFGFHSTGGLCAEELGVRVSLSGFRVFSFINQCKPLDPRPRRAI